MTNFASRTRLPAIDHAILHDGAAYASADADIDEVVQAAPGAVILLTQRRHLHIVTERDGHVEALAEETRDIQIDQPRRQIGRAQDDAARAVHLPRNADAHAQQVRAAG